MIRNRSPHPKACFDTRLEYGKRGEHLIQASREAGAQQVVTHYGDGYKRRFDAFLPAGSSRALNICLREIIAFEQEGQSRHFRQGMLKTAAVVESGGAASLAVVAESLASG